MIASLLNVFALLVQCATKQDVCPPWFIPDNSSSTGCSSSCAGSSNGKDIKCSSDQTLLQFGFCMTYDNVIGTTEYAKYPYVAQYPTADQDYIKLPQNVSLLNDFMCGPLNREGTLCGRCKPEYGPAPYSYTLQCERCWNHGYGWALYFAIELLPITVLYLLVMVFHIRATCSALSALVFMSQVVVYTVRLHTLLHMYIENEVKGYLYTALQVLLTLCGIWSLDFFFFALLSRKFAMVLVGLPHAVLLSYICYKLAEKAGLIFYLKTKYHVLKQLTATVRHASHQVDIEEEPDNDPFPIDCKTQRNMDLMHRNTRPLNPCKVQSQAESQEG